MVISHVHKYVFVELPFTGTVSISRALVGQSNGIRILYKHATYNEFRKIASPEEKKYFVFSCIRNPLDVAVSHYSKYKTGLHGKFDRMKESNLITRLANDYRLRRYDYVSETNADFVNYFLRYYRLPYDNWSAVSHGYCDFIIRFENLHNDFLEAITRIGIQKEVHLPLVNRTLGREKSYVSYYNAEAIERAKYVFGPFMKKWGYQFPSEWGEVPMSWRTQKEHQLANIFRNAYWLYLKPFAGRWAALEKKENKELKS